MSWEWRPPRCPSAIQRASKSTSCHLSTYLRSKIWKREPVSGLCPSQQVYILKRWFIEFTPRFKRGSLEEWDALCVCVYTGALDSIVGPANYPQPTSIPQAPNNNNRDSKKLHTSSPFHTEKRAFILECRTFIMNAHWYSLFTVNFHAGRFFRWGSFFQK